MSSKKIIGGMIAGGIIGMTVSNMMMSKQRNSTMKMIQKNMKKMM